MKRLILTILCLFIALSLVACEKDTTPVGQVATATPEISETEPPFEALLPELPFTGWTVSQESDNVYKMELIGLNTSAATNPEDSGEPDGADKDKLLDYLAGLPSCGFTVEEIGTDYLWLVTDSEGNTAEFKCGDGGCWITITKK